MKTITEAHNGKVKLKSKPGSGSTFEVFLPYGTDIVK
jgi:signal transduction histidine kinase